jgi:hypothetical protein
MVTFVSQISAPAPINCRPFGEPCSIQRTRYEHERGDVGRADQDSDRKRALSSARIFLPDMARETTSTISNREARTSRPSPPRPCTP